MGEMERGTILRDTDTQASLVLAIGSLLWKLVSVWSNVEFLLSIREEKFAVIFEFFQSSGWIILLVIGAIWFAVRFISWQRIEPHRTATWSMVVSCSTIAFLFGVLIAVRSSGGVPDIIRNWGGASNTCQATIDTSRLLSFRGKYKIGFACGVTDPTIEKLEDDRITVSNPFEIIPGAVTIVAPHRAGMAKVLREAGPIGAQIWFEPILLPNGVETAKIAKLSDLLRVGGKIVRAQYFR